MIVIDEWTPHNPGDPMPCPVDMRVQYRMRDGYLSTKGDKASDLVWGVFAVAYKGAEIVLWRPHPNFQRYTEEEEE